MKASSHGYCNYLLVVIPPSQIYHLDLRKLMHCRYKSRSKPIVSSKLSRTHRRRSNGIWTNLNPHSSLLPTVFNYTTFIKGLMNDPAMHNHPLLSNLILIINHARSTRMHSKLSLASWSLKSCWKAVLSLDASRHKRRMIDRPSCWVVTREGFC